jgi:hypothetical protein
MTIHAALEDVGAFLGEHMDTLFFYLGLEEDLQANLKSAKQHMHI